MVSLKEFKEKNCSGCYYNGSLGMKKKPPEVWFCAYAGKLKYNLEKGVCYTKTENGDRDMLRG